MSAASTSMAVHDRLTVAGAVTTPIARAGLAATWEELLRDRVVRIDVLDQTGDVDARRADALRRVGEDLTRRLLSPVLPTETPPLLDDGAVAPIEVSFRLTVRREELATTTRWDWRERHATTITHHAAALFTDLMGQRPVDQVVTQVDLSDQVDHPLVIVLLDNLAEAGMSAVEVEVAIDDQTSTDTVVLGPGAAEVRLDVDTAIDDVRWRLRSRFDRARTQLPDRTTAWRPLDARVLFVDPAGAFPARVLSVVGTGAFEEARVRVTSAGGQPQVAVIAPGDGHRFHLPGLDRVPLTVDVDWTGWAGAAPHPEMFEDVTDDLWMLDSPFATPTEITFIPVLEPDVVALTVALELGPGQWASTTSVTWEPSNRDPVDVEVRRLATAVADVQYRVTTVRETGATTGDLQQVEGSFTVVGVAGDMAHRRHRVEAAGGGPLRGKALLLELLVTAGAVERHVVVDDDRTGFDLDLVVPGDAPPTRLVVRAHLPTGELRTTDVREPGATSMLSPHATGGVAPPVAPPAPSSVGDDRPDGEPRPTT